MSLKQWLNVYAPSYVNACSTKNKGLHMYRLLQKELQDLLVNGKKNQWFGVLYRYPVLEIKEIQTDVGK